MSSYAQYFYQALNELEEKTKNSVHNWSREFPSMAFEFLKQFKTDELGDSKFLNEILSLEDWPLQHFRSGEFADLAFTVFRGTHFHLDLYIWNHQDTSIHDHHFCGAFKVIQGKSYHISYDFLNEEKIFPWLSKGQLVVNEKSDLAAGSVKIIDFSSDFIHQNLHTTNPCITLCLRTSDHPDIKLNGYYNTGMKIAYLPLSLKEKKQLDVLMHFPESQNHLRGLSDNALYQVLVTQTPLFVRAPQKFFDFIYSELEKRNSDVYAWAKNAVVHQAKLNVQLNSLFKA